MSDRLNEQAFPGIIDVTDRVGRGRGKRMTNFYYLLEEPAVVQSAIESDRRFSLTDHSSFYTRQFGCFSLFLELTHSTKSDQRRHQERIASELTNRPEQKLEYVLVKIAADQNGTRRREKHATVDSGLSIVRIRPWKAVPVAFRKRITT